MRRNLAISLACAGIFAVVAVCLLHPGVRAEFRARMSRHSVESRVREFGPTVEPVWRARCDAGGMAYPPASVVLVALKRERELRVYARGDGTSALLATYPFTAASGTIGPKLREGDRQVPEGVYAIESLNPNSRYHLSLRVGYPSDEDRRIAREEGRSQLGGDIMIHGGAGSVGCVAIGDDAIEEVFVLVAVVGTGNTEALMCPSAAPEAAIDATTPTWVGERYRLLADRLRELTP